MKKENKLIILKSIHTLIWLCFVFFISYMWYAALFNKVNRLLLISVTVAVSEAVILLGNKFICPLTTLAKNYTTSRVPGYDIYLPKFLAKHAVLIFFITASLGGILVLIRLLLNRLI